MLFPVLDEAEILTLGTLPAYRRRGAARLLLAEILRQSADHFFLEVAADNEAAIRLYSAAGFVETGRRARYYGNGTDAILMIHSSR